MKILSVSGILPIPGLLKDNDIVFEIYDHIKEKYPEIEVEFIRTIPHSNYLLSLIKDKWKIYYDAIKKKEYVDRGYKISVFPYLIFKSEVNLYSFLTEAAYYQNFFRIRNFVDVDIIHAQRIFSEGPLAYKIAKKLSKPLVITVRNETKYFNDSSAEKRARRILDTASFITTPNLSTYEFLKDKYPQKSNLIPHGIGENFFVEHKNNNLEPIRILTIAKFWEYKNIPDVIEALSQLRNEYEFIYQIVGDGYRRDVIEKCIRDHSMEDCIEMHSHIPHEEMPNVYAQADIFVMISYPETFGRVYFEAMAAGVPVVCAKNSGIHGLFEEGISGFSVSHKNTGDLKNILGQLISSKDLRKSVGQNGKELVRNYNWEAIIDQYQDLYSQAIKDFAK